MGGDAAGSYRSRALEAAIEAQLLKKVLVERELRGGCRGSDRSRALDGAIEVERLQKVLLAR